MLQAGAQERRRVRQGTSTGTHAWTIMKGALDVEDMGQDFGGTLSQREIEYLMKYEWAECAEDVVWRRSKLGIRLSEMEVSVIDHWMKNKSESHQYAEKQRSQHC